MVSLQSALLPEASKRPPCLSLVGSAAVASTATSKKRKRDGGDDRDDSRGEVVDGIELNFDAAPLPPEWQRCLDIKSGQIHYYNTRTQKRTWKDPRGEPDYRAAPAAAADEEESANCAPPGLDLELNLTFSPRPALAHQEKKKPKPAAPPPAPARTAAERRPPAEAAEDSREMVAAVCVRCHMLVMMCRASPACPNCKFLHTPSRAAPPPPEPAAPLKLGLQLLCCRD
ncbi:hypothetical protein PAHAL_9G572900 [Panicum hallii]|uniref:WW domain-containing protein n=1 Tax=Panicum hallii TaxID=206008 RepID=A0A2S3ITD5_9POAL|nr:uncharacterized protein LOC112876080 [Panicum hallii]PAN51134.1 hypothetical protein PAHAL_9G572900 [Panicum hallii]